MAKIVSVEALNMKLPTYRYHLKPTRGITMKNKMPPKESKAEGPARNVATIIKTAELITTASPKYAYISSNVLDFISVIHIPENTYIYESGTKVATSRLGKPYLTAGCIYN